MTMEWIGWIATAIFVGSYRCKDPVTLRRIQALAAALWVAYGVIIEAKPVIAANLLVAGVAVYSSLFTSRAPVANPEPSSSLHRPGQSSSIPPWMG